MLFIDASVGEDVVLNLTIKSKSNDLVDQPVNYPTIEIYKMDGTTSTEVLASTQMTEDVAGEYQYKWVGPPSYGTYKVRYTAQIDGLDFVGFDYVRARVPIDLYSGIGK